MHLTVGQWIAQHGTVPREDLWTSATAGQPFIHPAWLSAWLGYQALVSAAGIGLHALRFVPISLAFRFALLIARMLKASRPAMVLLAPVIFGVVWARAELRAALFTTMLLALELWLLISVHLGRRSRWWLWPLPLMFAVWINLHGGWPQGIALPGVIGGAVLLTRHWRRVFGRGAITHLSVWPMAMVLLACLLALLINPYGPSLVAFPWRMEASWIRALTPEWASPFPAHGWRMAGAGSTSGCGRSSSSTWRSRAACGSWRSGAGAPGTSPRWPS